MAPPNRSILAGLSGLGFWFIGATLLSGLGILFFQSGTRNSAPPASLSEPSEVAALGLKPAVEDRYECSFQDLDAEGILKRLQDDLPIWTLRPNRVEVVASGFSRVSQELGSKQAVERGMRLIAESTLRRSAQETLLTALALAAFEIQPPSKSELVALLKTALPDRGLPILEAYAPFLEELPATALLGELNQRVKDAGWTINPELGAFLVALAADCASKTGFTDLIAFIKTERSRLAPQPIIAPVVVRLSRSRPALARQILIEYIPKEGVWMADFAMLLRLSPTGVRDLLNSVPESGRPVFLTQYLRRALESPLDLAELANVFPARDVPLEVATPMAIGLLTLGGGRVSTWLEGIPEPDRVRILNSVLKTLTAFENGPISNGAWSPEVARAWLTATAGLTGIDTSSLAQTILNASKAAGVRLEDALQSCDRLEPQLRDSVRAQIYSHRLDQLAQEAPASIRAVLETFPAELQPGALRDAARSIALNAPNEMIAWLNSDPDPATKRILQTALVTTSFLPLATRKAWLLELADDPAQQPIALQAFVGDAISTNKADIIDLLAKLPASANRDLAATEFARRWAAMDPSAASVWIEQMPAGNLRDLTLSELVECSRDQPQSALANAAVIQSSELRLKAAGSVIDLWKDLDPKAGAVLLAESALSAADKLTLAKKLQ